MARRSRLQIADPHDTPKSCFNCGAWPAPLRTDDRSVRLCRDCHERAKHELEG